jgi:NADH-quinone oxidoreductase subunit E
MTHDMAKIQEIISRNPQNPGSLIAVLQDIQREFHYLPCEALQATASYNAFSLTPRGERIIRICQGTACHIKGADLIQEQLVAGLGLKPGETSPDMKYTLEVVNCLGVCAMAPVVVVNDKIHGGVRCDKALKLVKKD